MSPKNRWRTTAKNITRAVERMAPIDWDAMCAKQARVVLVHEPLGSSGVAIHGGTLASDLTSSSALDPESISRTRVRAAWKTGEDHELGLAEAVVEALFPSRGEEASSRWEMYAVDGIDYTHKTAAQEPAGRPYVATVGPGGDNPQVYINAVTRRGLLALMLTPAAVHPDALAVTQPSARFDSEQVEEAWKDYLGWL